MGGARAPPKSILDVPAEQGATEPHDRLCRPRIDGARARQGAIKNFLCQESDALSSFADTVEALRAL